MLGFTPPIGGGAALHVNLAAKRAAEGVSSGLPRVHPRRYYVHTY